MLILKRNLYLQRHQQLLWASEDKPVTVVYDDEGKNVVSVISL